MTSAMSLSNLVLLLRSGDADGGVDKFCEAFASAELSASCLPVITFSFCDNGIQELATKLRKPDAYCGVIFTSKNAVHGFQQALDLLKESGDSCLQNVAAKLREKEIFVIGKATKKSASNLGLTLRGSSCGNAEELANEIIAERLTKIDCNPAEAAPYLFPCGDLALPTLPRKLKESNILLEQYVVYKTVPDPNFETNFQALCENVSSQFGAVMFFSPSGVKTAGETIKTLKNFQHGLKLCAFGKSTEKAMEQHGLPCHSTAETPTPEGACKAVQQAMN